MLNLSSRNQVVLPEVTYSLFPCHILTKNKVTFLFYVQESPFKGKMFPRCAVMGSSGMLSNSHCGGEIDSADYVFR